MFHQNRVSVKWEVLFQVEDSGEHPLYRTNSIPVDSGDNEYAWRNLDLTLSMSDNHMFRFKAYLVPVFGEERGSFFWFACDVLTSAFTFASPRYSTSKTHFVDEQNRRISIRRTGVIEQFKFGVRVSLKAHYRSTNNYFCFEENGDLPASTYTVSDILLKMEPQHIDMLRLVERERHKLVSVLRLSTEYDKQLLSTVYLGRAQLIETEEGYEPHTRRYMWKSKEKEKDESAFPGLTLKTDDFWDWDWTREQHRDMMRLNIFSGPLSARYGGGGGGTSFSEAVMPDNDAFSNKRRILPITMQPEQVVSLNFYNIYAEHRVYSTAPLILKWSDFVPSKQWIRKEVHANLVIEVRYLVMLRKQQCQIQSIVLCANNYQKTLFFEDPLRRINSV